MKKRLVSRILRKRGFQGYTIKEKVYADLFENGVSSWRETLTWYRRGFLMASKKRLRLDTHNYGLYVPDLPYARSYPINNSVLRKMVEDKLSFRYFFSTFVQHLPAYYCYLQRGSVYKLADWPVELTDLSVESLVRAKGMVALKKVFGSQGKGFFVLECEEDQFRISGREVDVEEMTSFLRTLDNYLVTEYIRPSTFIQSFYPKTTNSARVIVLGGFGINPFVAGAMLRMGTSKSGEVDNVPAGGVFCGIDVETGRLFSPKKYRDGELVDSPYHPDSQVKIDGYIPNWTETLDSILRIFSETNFLLIAGFDVVFTEDGFRILEINGHPELRHIQVFKPLLQEERSREWFLRMFSEKNIGIN